MRFGSKHSIDTASTRDKAVLWWLCRYANRRFPGAGIRCVGLDGRTKPAIEALDPWHRMDRVGPLSDFYGASTHHVLTFSFR